MPLKFFSVPAIDSRDFETELNGFLASHRILAVQRELIDCGRDSFWAICVDYVLATSADGNTPGTSKKSRVDYKEILTPDQFDRYVALREVRAQIAKEEGVPVYTIFTNEQLATMVTTNAASKSDLAAIQGVGQARIDKYAEAFLALLSKDVQKDSKGTPR